jgi:uncharacterized protein YbjT (DUF2867 family)
MQTILGANGVIGRELSRHLPQYSGRVRQVSRSPKTVNATDELFTADLLDAKATADAVAGSAVTYLVAGLKYDHKVWEDQWPKVMRNAMMPASATAAHSSLSITSTRTAASMM